MAHRSPVRFLAPLALVAFAVTLVLVVQHASVTGSSGSSGTSGSTPAKSPSGSASNAGSRRHKSHRARRRTYVVRPGDTPSGIAAKTGVPLATLQRLNPSLDPQALSVGQRLKLR